MDDKEENPETAVLREQVAQLERMVVQQRNLAEAYRAQLNAIILILKSPVG